MNRDLASLHHELSETISQLDWAMIYSRALDGQDVDARHVATIRQKLDLLSYLAVGHADQRQGPSRFVRRH